MINFSKIIISDNKILENKKNIFKKSFNKNKDNIDKKGKIIVVTDFDFTLFNKYNYSTGEKYESSFGMYNQDVFGGNQKDFKEKRIMLHDIYAKYEDNFSISEKIKEDKMREWVAREMEFMIHPNFTRDSIRKMVELKNEKNLIYFKKNVREFYEKLIELNIPIIIVSGGIKEIIIEILKLMRIRGLENYIKKKRMLFIANEFIFDENNNCLDYNRNIIHGYNKSEYVKKIIDENFPDYENVFVLGDLTTDYKAIKKLNLDKNKNIIGIGYIYFSPEDLKNKDFDIRNNIKVNEFKKIFDINLLMDEGYDYPLSLLNIFQ